MQQDTTEEFVVRCAVKARERKAAREENNEAIASEVSLPEGAPPPEHPGPRGVEHSSQKDEGHRERENSEHQGQQETYPLKPGRVSG